MSWPSPTAPDPPAVTLIPMASSAAMIEPQAKASEIRAPVRMIGDSKQQGFEVRSHPGDPFLVKEIAVV